MKVGILTLHSSYSYGACLQAYATYIAVRQMGHDVVMIDYVNSYEQDQNYIISKKPGQNLKKRIIKTLENIVLRKHHNLKMSFSEFHTLYNKTKRITSKEELNSEKFDCLISGSDQLWNPEIFGGIDLTFFLNFGDEDTQRISYAASAGSHRYTMEEINIIKPFLSRYNAISVREKKLKDQIESIMGKKVSIVVDPTFLISSDEWKKLSSFEKKGEFILLYMIGVPYKDYRKKFAKIVNYYKTILNLPVWAVTPFSFVKAYGEDYSLNVLSPIQLIGAINKATMIITSSFHGVAFSINLNKRFVALETGNPDRINNLLDTVGLSYRLIKEFDRIKCEDLLKDINYDCVNSIIERDRMASLNWLRESI